MQSPRQPMMLVNILLMCFMTANYFKCMESTRERERKYETKTETFLDLVSLLTASLVQLFLAPKVFSMQHCNSNLRMLFLKRKTASIIFRSIK